MVEEISRAVVADDQIQQAIIVIIAPGAALTDGFIRRERRVSYLCERAVSIVAKKKVELVDTGDEHVRKAVVVIVTPRATLPASVRSDHTIGHPAKAPVAVVMK